MAYRDKEQAKQYLADWHQRNKSRRMERWKQRYRADEQFRRQRNQYMAEYRDKLKDQVFAALGSTCRCCGEILPTMLAIDHVQNDGNVDRLGKRAGARFYAHVRNQGFPTWKYQVLCHSCNMSKYINNGTCEHKTQIWKWFRHALGVNASAS